MPLEGEGGSNVQRKILFPLRREKNKEGKGEKYSEKENILPSNEKEVNIWRMKEDISETK